MKKRTSFIIGVLLFTIVLGILLILGRQKQNSLISPLIKTPAQLAKEYPPVDKTPIPSPTAVPTATPSPTPKPLTFAEMNKLYGPCVVLPTLMYHHIQDLGIAKTEGHAQLTVDTKYFRADMQYLKDKGYTVTAMTDLIDFFDSGKSLPKKSILLTFDDGYDDFGTDAAPILREFSFPATLFVPTGLMQNPGYLTWSTIQSIAVSQPVLMANHTWSHHNMGASKGVIEREVTTAEHQLTERGLDVPKVFAYPYGTTSQAAVQFLQLNGYKLAFTTVHGSTLCKQQRLLLPRLRIGNAPLSSYGL